MMQSGVAPVYTTVPGSVASFTTLHAAPLQHLIVSIVPQQSGSGDPSPNNVRPITGYSSVNSSIAGKNLLDESLLTNGTYNGSGQYVSHSSYVCTPLIRVNAGAKIRYSFSLSLNGCYSTFFALNGSFMSQVSNGSGTSKTVTIPNGAAYVAISGNATGLTLNACKPAQVEIGETATAYEPYNGASYSATISTPPGTVYGGTLDLVTGELVVDTKLITVSSITTVASASYIKQYACDGFTTDNSIYPTIGPTSQAKMQYADKLKFWKKDIWGRNDAQYVNGWCLNINQIHLNISNDLIGVTDYTQETTATVKTKLNAWLANNPVTVTIPISPVTYQLTGQQITDLLGNNNVWSDAGDVSVTYRSN